MRYTHFISLPLSSQSLSSLYPEFVRCITPYVPPKSISALSTLHLTLGVCSLTSLADIEQAVSCLRSCSDDLDQCGSINLRLRSVACLQTNSARARVLYIPPSAPESTFNRLIQLCGMNCRSQIQLIPRAYHIQVYCAQLTWQHGP